MSGPQGLMFLVRTWNDPSAEKMAQISPSESSRILALSVDLLDLCQASSPPKLAGREQSKGTHAYDWLRLVKVELDQTFSSPVRSPNSEVRSR